MRPVRVPARERFHHRAATALCEPLTGPPSQAQMQLGFIRGAPDGARPGGWAPFVLIGNWL